MEVLSFFHFFFLLQLVYAIALSQSSSITAGPVYTVFSLIPPAAISFVTWMLKTKVFQFDISELQEDEHTTEDTNEQRNADVVPEERIPLLAVEDTRSASEPNGAPNHDSGQDYGATRDENHNETNC